MTRDRIKEACAAAAHEVNKVFCDMTGDASQAHWEQAPEWQRTASIEGVAVALQGASPRQLFEAWKAAKQRDGWIHGPVKDGDKKTHPCLVEYDDLPPVQKAKDGLYSAVVGAMQQALQGLD